MRLVNADDLNLCNVHLIDGKMVCDAPTIHAVPIEVLQDMREEIEKTVSRYAISRERGAMGQVEWSDRLIKESDVFGIIDKYLEQYKEDAG